MGRRGRHVDEDLARTGPIDTEAIHQLMLATRSLTREAATQELDLRQLARQLDSTAEDTEY